jgi:hypothetical protein
MHVIRHNGISASLARLVESCPQTLIRFEIDIHLSGTASSEIDWKPLRDVVTSERFPALIYFNIRVKPVGTPRPSDEAAHSLIKSVQNTFHRLHEQKILKCNVIPEIPKS